MGKSTPKAPNPRDTSAAQTGTNVATAVANTYAQNGNITTGDGTRTTTFREQDIYDPYTKETYKGVIPDVVETLSPAQQAIKDQQDQASLGLSTLANKQTGRISEYMDTPFSYDSGAHTKWATDLYGKINQDDFDREQSQAQSRLSNMGIKLGSEAYNNEMSRLERSQGRQRDQFLLDSEGQGFSQAQATRNQPFNEITALMSGGQVSQPNFTGASSATIPTTDNAAIINQDYANRVAAANQQNAGVGAALSGLGSVFSLSDKRAKKDVKKVGEMSGQNVYKYRMKSGGGIKLGLIAQDVEKKTPEAVAAGPNGLKRVNYGIALGRRAA
ncbi:MAG: tail fiber domain-containing protein [Aestuariivirga sp.]